MNGVRASYMLVLLTWFFSSASKYSCYEFMSTIAMSCPEGSISRHSSPTSSCFFLPPLFQYFTTLDCKKAIIKVSDLGLNTHSRLFSANLDSCLCTRPLIPDGLFLCHYNNSPDHLWLSLSLSLHSPRKNGEATGVDIVCTYHPDHIGHGFATEQLYLELSKLTYGVTQLGPYTLDQDSLYVNGKGWVVVIFLLLQQNT